MATHHPDHDHAEISHSARPQYYEVMEIAIRELLVEKKMIAAGEISGKSKCWTHVHRLWARRLWLVRGVTRHSSLGCWRMAAARVKNSESASTTKHN